MIDTFICADTIHELIAYCGKFKHVIGPSTGILAQEEMITGDEDIIIPAREAVGDPYKFYACIRTETTPVIEPHIQIIDPTLGAKIVGIWA